MKKDIKEGSKPHVGKPRMGIAMGTLRAMDLGAGGFIFSYRWLTFKPKTLFIFLAICQFMALGQF